MLIPSSNDPAESSRLSRKAIQRTRDRISYNATARFIGRGVGGLITLAALHLSTKYFGPREWGPIVTALAFATIFSSLSDFGISNLSARELARPGAKRAELFGAGILSASFVALALTAIAAALDAVAFGGRPETRLLIWLLLPTIPLTALFAVISAVFTARSRNDIRAIFDVVSSALVLIGVAVIVSQHDSMGAYAMLLSSAAAAMALLALAVVSFYYRPSFRQAIRQAIPTTRSAAPLGVSQIMSVFYGQFDTLLVAAFLSTSMVAWFGLDSQIAGFFWSIPGMVTAAATPHFMRKDDAGRRALSQQLVETLASVGALTALAGMLFAHEALQLIGGAKFLGATGALRILFIASSVGFITSTVEMIIFLSGKQRAIIKISIFILLVNLAANLVAIPVFGIDGAAGALLISELLGLGYSVLVLRKSTGYVLTFRLVAVYIVLACLIGGGYEAVRLSVHLPTAGPWVAAEAVVVTGIYGSALALIRRKRPLRPAA
jgi:O-antigen/teichoic acid export membrane protein